jgi:hypothetical protein
VVTVIGRVTVGAVLVVVAVGAASLAGLGKIPGLVGWAAAAVGAVAALSALVSAAFGELIKELSISNLRRRAGIRQARLGGALMERNIDKFDPVSDLGVHPALRDAHQSAIPPYASRAIDAELDALVAAGGLVVVEGDSAVGKSRSAFEALMRARRDGKRRRVIVPRDGLALRGAIESGLAVRNRVIWLDDLERFVSPTGLDASLLSALLHPDNSNVLILCTLRSNVRQELGFKLNENPSVVGDSLRNVAKLLAGASVVRVGGRLNEDEVRQAALLADERVDDALRGMMQGVGFAEILAAGPAAIERLKSGADGENRYGAALVQAAIDFRRAGYLQPVPQDWLHAVAPKYLDERWRFQMTQEARDAALVWATTPVRGASACLRPVATENYRVFDYLVDRVESEINSLLTEERHRARVESLARIPEEVWHLLLEEISFDDPQFLGCLASAERAGHPGMFIRFTIAAKNGDLHLAELATGERLVALALTCMRLGYCVACYLKMLNLDPRNLLVEVIARLQPLFGEALSERLDGSVIEALYLAEFLAQDGSMTMPDTVMGEVASTLDGEAAYGIGELLWREKCLQAARVWMEVAASVGNEKAKASIVHMPPLEIEPGFVSSSVAADLVRMIREADFRESSELHVEQESDNPE